MDFRDLQTEIPEGKDVWQGTVASAPTDLSDLIQVIIPDFDEHLVWGPCFWQARDAVSLPAVGDACLVMFDNRRVPWVVAWWPF